MSIFEDAWGAVTNPTNLLRALPYVGWPAIIIDLLPGALGYAASATLTAAPGLVRGESFSDAWIAESTWHLQQVLKYAGPQAAEQVNTEFANNKDVQGLVDTNAYQSLRQQGVSSQDALAKIGSTPDDVARKLGVRPDVAAMLLNLALHERVYDLDRQFDPATGAYKPTIKLGPLDAGPLMPPKDSAAYLLTRYQEAVDGRAAAQTKVLQLQIRQAPKELIRTAQEEYEAANRHADREKQIYDRAVAREQAMADAERRARANVPTGGALPGVPRRGFAVGPPSLNLRDLPAALLLTSPLWILLLSRTRWGRGLSRQLPRLGGRR